MYFLPITKLEVPNTETETFFNSLYLLPGKTVIIGMDKKSTSDKKKMNSYSL